ncbi:patatin-like phospholipase family protein [Hymenobacter busanensis]|uniref:Patatin-like phospholipase family protein n=1 Tax=Hymenobacter busanensis TaxID=2607656 RepID=A0A7L4ZZB8_9BACT|nr:patatin-like phospholipase family protein [Hymenobacter busanensis]KAA9333198.1 patatin-like phospholipase family protein [Hymenobacter busanensis]QHJ08125.1 patatin [Hymenobacter busanensis]
MLFRRCFFLLALFSSLLSAPGLAQTTPAPTYRNLVMEGGGIRGIAYGGALQELEARGVLGGIQRVGGTSAGAIQAALLAVGYAPQEIIAVVNRTPVQRLNDGRFIFFGGSHRLVKQYGWYRGDQFSKYLSELVARKTGNGNLTLGELHTLAQQQPGRYRDLYTTGTNLTAQRVQVFSYETHPHLRVADAVRISMSIPLYFRAVLLDAEGRVVHGKPAERQHVEVLVDGGLLANYPIDLFDDARYLGVSASDTLPAAGPFVNPETLGLRLDRAEQIALDTLANGRQALAPYDIHSFGSYMGALYTVAIENLNPAQPQDWRRTVSINTAGFNPKIKRLSDEQKQTLVSSGRQGVQAFMQRAQR